MWDKIISLIFQLLSNVFGDDWEPSDVADALAELKNSPPRKAQLPDLDAALKDK